jgi:hypothetical protein
MRGITTSCVNSSAAAHRITNWDPLTPDFLHSQAEKYFVTEVLQKFNISYYFLCFGHHPSSVKLFKKF